MFTLVHHVLMRTTGRHVHLTADVHDDLEAWRNLFLSLASRPTHLRKIHPSSLTWMGTIDASVSIMEGVC